MYDVTNRESFEALPLWYSELESCVSESVVKIVVGNKRERVRCSLSLLYNPITHDRHPRNTLDKYRNPKARPLLVI